MRKETRKIVEAFAKGQTANASRTSTDGNAVYLHGNRIFWRDRAHSDRYFLSMCGWGSVTTRDRLNALLTKLNLPYRINQKDFSQFITHEHTGETVELDPSDTFEITV